jgi:hypothetical protein
VKDEPPEDEPPVLVTADVPPVRAELDVPEDPPVVPPLEFVETAEAREPPLLDATL